jgi:hypothetical protein
VKGFEKASRGCSATYITGPSPQALASGGEGWHQATQAIMPRSAERFILMCGRAGTSVPPAAVSPATQSPSPLPHPVSTRSIVRQAREPQGWTQGSSSGAAGQGCMTTLAISVAVSTRSFLLAQGETCDALAVVSPDSPTDWHGYLEQSDIHQARPRPAGGPVRRLPICAG